MPDYNVQIFKTKSFQHFPQKLEVSALMFGNLLGNFRGATSSD